MRVGPAAAPPEDYLRIDAPVNAFGAGIGQAEEAKGQGLQQVARGVEALGQGAFTADRFFGEVAADNASNNFQDQADKLLHGDPSKMVPGPDGQMQPDLGFLGLKGRAALDARPQVEAALDNLQKSTSAGLQTPEQQLQFDTFSRRYRSIISAQVGSHADEQANVWFNSVNNVGEKLAIDGISRDPLNMPAFAANTADLIRNRVRNAQINGTDPDDALISGKRDALKAQVLAVGANNPSQAIDILNKNRAIAGVDYEPLMREFQDRAYEQQGIASGTQAWTQANGAYSYSSPSQPIFAQTTSAVPGGYSPRGLARTVQIESRGNPNATNGVHKGLGQFSDQTWAEFGTGSPFDPQQALYATQKYAAANASIMEEVFGRRPTDSELYLAHQQGALGAIKLLSNPNARAGDLVGDKAIRENGGDPNAPASAFVSLWIGKFNGAGSAVIVPGGGQTFQLPPEASGAALAPAPQVPPIGVEEPPPVAPVVAPPPMRMGTASPRADAVNAILKSNLPAQAKFKAMYVVNALSSATQLAQAQDEKSKKDASEAAAQKYVTTLLDPNAQIPPTILSQIAHDPQLSPEAKITMTNLALSHADNSSGMAQKQYGRGFWGAWQAINSAPDDPKHISDPMDIYRRAGPGGDLTIAGADRIVATMKANEKGIDDQAVNQAKTGLMAYARGKLSFDQEMLVPGLSPLKDPRGAQIFNAQFIPKFEAAFDAWVKDGKNPWDPNGPLSQDFVDKMIKPLRSSSEMAQSRISAMGDVEGNALANAPNPIPAVPQGVNAHGWQKIISQPPAGPNGPYPYGIWAQAIGILRADPSPHNKAFFDQHFAPAGYTADEVLSELNPVPVPPAAIVGPVPQARP